MLFQVPTSKPGTDLENPKLRLRKNIVREKIIFKIFRHPGGHSRKILVRTWNKTSNEVFESLSFNFFWTYFFFPIFAISRRRQGGLKRHGCLQIVRGWEDPDLPRGEERNSLQQPKAVPYDGKFQLENFKRVFLDGFLKMILPKL